MEFTPGKYRMTNGEQAIVVCDVGENPIGDNHDPYPLKGYAKHGTMSWTREGKRYNFCDDGFDLLEDWTDPPTAEDVCKELLMYDDVNASVSEPMRRIIELARAAIAAEKARTA